MSQIIQVRSIIVCLLLAVAIIVVTAVSVSLGSFQVSAGELFDVVTGHGSRAATKVVLEWRAPRALAAVAFGAALALGGAVFQSLTRNPLGSPDIVGFSVGSYTGVLLVILAGGTGFAATAGGALAGGILTAVAVYLLAFRRGVQGFRLIIVGIAVSSMLTSVNTWITVKVELDVAMQAAVWGAGTLNGLRWSETTPALVAIAVLVVPLALMAAALRDLELGDTTAALLGRQVEKSRLWLVVVAVALTATVTAVAGPIGFVALAAPQLARRLAGSPGIPLLSSALMGALLLAASDVVALHLLDGLAIPVGAVTVCLGGLYLVWLLARETKR